MRAIKALYPGSFDPITNGHLDILKRSLAIFPEVTILVASHELKHPLFTPEERIEIIQESTKQFKGVKVKSWPGLIMDYAKKEKIGVVIRGLRAASDFEYEFMMATMNKTIHRGVETLFMMTSQDLYFVSSSMIKGLYLYGGDIQKFVPKPVIRHLTRKFKS